MRSYHQRVSLLSPHGNHVRSVPAALARAMVEAGSAAPEAGFGRIRAVKLIETAATSAERIGEPHGVPFGTTFTRWEYLPESGTRVIAHHPRCTYEPSE